MTERNRILLNTAAIYGSSLLALFLGLFSARWILLGLGQSDFGLYGVVGSIIAFITFLNTTLSGSMSRFFAYAIGEGQKMNIVDSTENLCRWFNLALTIHVLLPVALVAVGYPLGIHAIRNWLVIPPDRMAACIAVFDAAIISAFFGMVSVPFVALFQAHQLFFELSFLGVISSLINFAIAYSLLDAGGDRLAYYAHCLMYVNVSHAVVQIVWARLRFGACRLQMQYLFDRERFYDFFAFAGSKLFGAVCVIFRTQGGVLLLNSFFTPQVNAAYTVSVQVSAHTSSLSQSLIGALQPAVATREGAANREGMLRMAQISCRIATFLVIVFVIPLLVEIDWVLKAWLKDPPPYASSFCACMLVMLIIDKMSVGYMLAANAYGKKMMVYELVNGTLLLLALPFSYLCFRLGLKPYWLSLCLCLSMALYACARIGFCKWQLGVSILGWMRDIVCPDVVIVLVSALVGWYARLQIPSSFCRVVLVSLLCGVTTLLLGARFLLTGDERRQVVVKIRRMFR